MHVWFAGNDMAHQLHLHTIHLKKFELVIPWGRFSTGFIEITIDHLSVLAAQATLVSSPTDGMKGERAPLGGQPFDAQRSCA